MSKMITRFRLTRLAPHVRFMRPEGAQDISDRLNQANAPFMDNTEEIFRYDDGTWIKLCWSADQTYLDVEINRMVEFRPGPDGILEVALISPEGFHWRDE